MILTRETFVNALVDKNETIHKGIYNLKHCDIDAYTALLREALDGDYSQLKRLRFGHWHFASTRPYSLDWVLVPTAHHRDNVYRYEIELTRLDTVGKIACWVDHLHTEGWFNCHNGAGSPLNFFKAIVELNRRGKLKLKGRDDAMGMRPLQNISRRINNE